MKQAFLMSLGFATISMAAVNDGVSRSWFNPRSISFNSALNQSQTLYNWLWNNTDTDYQFVIKPFIQSSTNHDELACYFTPNGQSVIRMRQDGTGDVNPRWFALCNGQPMSYKSDACFRPKRTAYGFTLDFRRRFSWNDCMWFRANTALVRSVNNLKIAEKNRNVVGLLSLPPVIKNVCDAFSLPLSHSKMECCDVKKIGFDDILLRLGYDFYQTDRRVVSAWLAMSVPTRSKDHDVNLFSPVIGSDGVGFGGGFNCGQIISERGDCRTTLIGQADFRYVLESRQKRTFDLTKNGNWSRYLIFANKTTGQNLSQLGNSIPGNSLLNLEAKVTQGFEFNWLYALHFSGARWDFELGFNTWYRQAERVSLDNKRCPKDFTSWGVYGFDTTPLTSSSKAKVSSRVETLQDATFTTIKESDLNLCSAAHPRAVSYTVYTSGQYSLCGCKYLSLGFAYEFAQDKNSLEQYNFFFGLEKRF